MRLRMPVLILALTAAAWAQTANPTTASTPPNTTPTAKAKPACCQQTATDAKGETIRCPRHAKMAADGKQAASCCAGKEANSCLKNDKTGSSCCARANSQAARNCCHKAGQECGPECCSQGKSEKPA